jgi:hypothetical protein
MQKNKYCLLLASFLVSIAFFHDSTHAQESGIRYGQGVPPAVRLINVRALRFLADTQAEDGSWSGPQSGAGITGICVMAMMASGEDPDFGPFSEYIRKALRRIIIDQDPDTGVASGTGHGSFYHHGFATLALSEAYGVVNERVLWQGSGVPIEGQRTIGQALELAVRAILTAQEKNPFKAWRYSPDSTDADTGQYPARRNRYLSDHTKPWRFNGALGHRDTRIRDRKTEEHGGIQIHVGFHQDNNGSGRANVSPIPTVLHGSGLVSGRPGRMEGLE